MLMRGVVSMQSGKVKKQQGVKKQRGGAPQDQRRSHFPAPVRSWRRRIPLEQPRPRWRARNCPNSKFGDLKAVTAISLTFSRDVIADTAEKH